ncbi:hypothetical protein PSPO01_11926 [Paraphaeosphaeria sporulosa]
MTANVWSKIMGNWTKLFFSQHAAFIGLTLSCMHGLRHSKKWNITSRKWRIVKVVDNKLERGIGETLHDRTNHNDDIEQA